MSLGSSGSQPLPPPSNDPTTSISQPSQTQAQGVELNAQNLEQTKQSMNYLACVFQALLSSINVTSDLSETTGQAIQSNADLQMKLNQSMQGVQNFTVPANASSATLQNINNLNANLTVVRQNTQGLVLALRQVGQQDSANAQVYVNNMQQIGSEITAVLKVITTVMTLITRISPGVSTQSSG